ncbi:T-cell surface glycoprotein CD1c-like isoform X2 [Dendropsophus ebraccatus]|uniref:T-cell surface glycoprotein CD1c-like isoform X2 n=1 Tax=Dendropsophus ebraccatus TaxID=150705 RepID=UPI003831E90C
MKAVISAIELSVWFLSIVIGTDIHATRMSKDIGIKYSGTLQCLAGCVANNKDPENYFYKLAVNGEDLVYLDVKNSEWVTGHSVYAQAVATILQRDKVATRSVSHSLRSHCYKMSQILLEVGKEALSKKSKPEVYYFIRSWKSELRCIATGFYPKPINITLWKDEETIMDNVMFTETLPNGDGTYQKTAILTAGWEQQSTVYCQVEHSSLEEPLVKNINIKHNGLAWLVVGIILGAVICAALLVWLVKNKKHRAYTSRARETVDRILWRSTEGDVSPQR